MAPVYGILNLNIIIYINLCNKLITKLNIQQEVINCMGLWLFWNKINGFFMLVGRAFVLNR